MTLFIIIIATIIGFPFLLKYSEMQKLYPIIDRGFKEGLSQEAMIILLTRDATRSLGGALQSSQVEDIKRIVTRRALNANTQIPIKRLTDVEDVFRYLNQSASPFLLQRNEHALAMIPAVGLREPRSVKTTRGVYGGPRVRIAKGFSVHAGAFKSTSYSSEELKNIDGGDLIITNQRLFFAGKNRTVNVPFKKIVSLEPFSDSLILHKEGRDRTQYFVWPSNLMKVKDIDGNIQPLTGNILFSLIEKQLG